MSKQAAVEKAEPAKTTALAPMEQMRDMIQKLTHEFKAALPPQIPVERFVRTTITTLQMNPDLLKCDRKSVLATCMKAAQDGLLLDGREAAAIPYGTKCQYIPMVAGILKKMRNSGEIASAAAHVVYEKDHFEYKLGDDEKIIHVPAIDGERGKLIAVYAIVRTKDGGVYREVLNRADVEKVRASSKAQKSGPWMEWEEEMWKKTALKRIAKRTPSSADLEKVIEHENEATGFIQRRAEIAPETPGAEARRPSFLSTLAESEKDAPPEAEREPGSDEGEAAV